MLTKKHRYFKIWPIIFLSIFFTEFGISYKERNKKMDTFFWTNKKK